MSPAPAPTLMVRNPNGRYVKATRDDILRAHVQIQAASLPRGSVLNSTRATRQFLINAFSHHLNEVFCALFLDNQHRVLAFEELFQGTIDGASVHPREVVRRALDRGAAAVIFAHNHPSGVAEPSQTDELITLRLKDALGLVEIRVLDHLVVGGQHCISMAERGVI